MINRSGSLQTIAMIDQQTSRHPHHHDGISCSILRLDTAFTVYDKICRLAGGGSCAGSEDIEAEISASPS